MGEVYRASDTRLKRDVAMPVPLFLTRIAAIQGVNVTPNYFVSPDGQRFPRKLKP